MTLVASIILSVFGRLVPWVMISANREVVIVNEFSSSLHVFSLNNVISKPPDRTGNGYNSHSFSKIISPIIAGS